MSRASATTVLRGTLTIPAGLNGPSGTAHGGVAAGLLAQHARGAVEVRLHRPPPLSVPMQVTGSGDELTASCDGQPVLTALPGRVAVEPPAVGLDEATAATGPAQEHVAPTCVVCGPCSPTPLRVFPGRLGTSDVYAARWQAPAWAADDRGDVRPELLWGALDCPGGFAIADPHGHSRTDFFPALGTITAELRSAVRVEEPVVVVGWPLGRDGRRLHAGTAVLGADGSVRAVARQTCIAVPLDWAGGS